MPAVNDVNDSRTGETIDSTPRSIRLLKAREPMDRISHIAFENSDGSASVITPYGSIRVKQGDWECA